MIASIIFESRKWIVAQSDDRTEITDLALKVKATRTLHQEAHSLFLKQWNEKAPEDRHDLITEWFHG